MPLQDWSKVPSGLFHHFHQCWTVQISGALNRGLLPAGLSALVEQRAGTREPDVLAIEERDYEPGGATGGTAVLERPKTAIVRSTEKQHYASRANRIAVRHHLGRIVAIIEVVSPGNKDSEAALRSFTEKIVDAMEHGIHVLLLDLFPPSRRDPDGIHKAIWDHFEEEAFPLAASRNRIFASYESTPVKTAFIETLAVGETLPSMPLFVAAGQHIAVPLEDTYQRAWADTPQSVKRLVE